VISAAQWSPSQDELIGDVINPIGSDKNDNNGGCDDINDDRGDDSGGGNK